MAYEGVNTIQLRLQIILTGGDDQQGIVGASDRLGRFSASGEKWIGNTGNDKTNGPGGVAFENARSLVRHIPQSFDCPLHSRQRPGVDSLSTIDDARDGCGPDAGRGGHFTQSWFLILLCHIVQSCGGHL